MDNDMINSIAIEGGGIKTVSFLGYLDALSKSSISPFMLENIDYISGTSAGSIIGLSLALRVQPKESFDIVKSVLSKNNTSSTILRVLSIPVKYGMYDTENMLEGLIVSLFEYADVDSDITFGDFYSLSGIDLRVTATDLINNKLKVFSYKEDEDVKIKDAIYASCSFPIVFRPRVIKGIMYADGGILNNYPVDVFTDVEDNLNMIGLRVDKVSEVQPSTPNSIVDYIIKILVNVTRSSSERYLPEKHWKNTILIQVDNSVGLLDFDKVDYLFDIGRYKV